MRGGSVSRAFRYRRCGNCATESNIRDRNSRAPVPVNGSFSHHTPPLTHIIVNELQDVLVYQLSSAPVVDGVTRGFQSESRDSGTKAPRTKGPCVPPRYPRSTVIVFGTDVRYLTTFLIIDTAPCNIILTGRRDTVGTITLFAFLFRHP